MNQHNRVVVTGMGLLAANGIGVDAFWDSLVEGRSGISKITRFDASEHDCRIAGEIKGFDPTNYINLDLNPGRMARQTQLALAASLMACEDAEFSSIHCTDMPSVLVALGTSTSAFDVIESAAQRMHKRGAKGVGPSLVRCSAPFTLSEVLSNSLDLPTECLTLSSACTAGIDAVVVAAGAIKSGKFDCAIAGGSDAPITPLIMASAAAAGLAPKRALEPHRASRPFDRDRETGVISEGAAVVVLENLEHALARGARTYIEITGWGSHSDGRDSDPGSGLENSMKIAIANASLRPVNIEYVCAHGPGHPVIDRVETEMIKKVFGTYAYSIPTSSIKGATGNPFSACGPMQLISCCMTASRDMIPPTANYENMDPACDLDYVPGSARFSRVNKMILNVHAISGSNTSLVVEKVK